MATWIIYIPILYQRRTKGKIKSKSTHCKHETASSTINQHTHTYTYNVRFTAYSSSDNYYAFQHKHTH